MLVVLLPIVYWYTKQGYSGQQGIGSGTGIGGTASVLDRGTLYLVQHNSGGIDTSTGTGGTISVPGRGTAVVTTAKGGGYWHWHRYWWYC